MGAAGEPEPPGFDAIAFVSRGLARVPWAHEVVVVLACSLDEAARRFPPTLAELEDRPDGVEMKMRADSLDWAAGILAGAGCSFRWSRRTSCGAPCGRWPRG